MYAPTVTMKLQCNSRFCHQEQEKINAAKKKLRSMESKHFETKERLKRTSKSADKQSLELELSSELELMDTQRRLIDDLEFQQLEVSVGEGQILISVTIWMFSSFVSFFIYIYLLTSLHHNYF